MGAGGESLVGPQLPALFVSTAVLCAAVTSLLVWSMSWLVALTLAPKAVLAAWMAWATSLIQHDEQDRRRAIVVPELPQASHVIISRSTGEARGDSHLQRRLATLRTTP